MPERKVCRLRAALAALAMLVSSSVWATSPADFYRGRTVDLVVSTGTGTSYDLMGRLLAKYLAPRIPGAPTIVVQNMPGADGLVAANYLWGAAPRDGAVIAGLQGTIPFLPLLGTKQAVFQASKFNWLGSVSDETCVVLLRSGAKAQSFDDLKTVGATIGTSSSVSNPAFYARLVNTLFGAKLRLILGYPSQNDVFVAMDRGEVDGHSCVFYSALASTRPAWLTNGQVRLLLQIGPEKLSELPNVPFASDLVTKSEDAQLLQASLAPLALGRPYAMPPGTPPDRVEAVRAAFQAVLADPAFLAEIKRLRLQVHDPRTGAEVERLIEATYALPQDSIGRMKELMQP